jgi:hypothetical protein
VKVEIYYKGNKSVEEDTNEFKEPSNMNSKFDDYSDMNFKAEKADKSLENPVETAHSHKSSSKASHSTVIVEMHMQTDDSAKDYTAIATNKENLKNDNNRYTFDNS